MLKYPLSPKFKPLVIQSYRHIVHNNITYKRRLKINRFNALLIDEQLGTHIAHQRTRFVVLDLEDIKKACMILNIEYKHINTYFDIDSNLCSFV